MSSTMKAIDAPVEETQRGLERLAARDWSARISNASSGPFKRV